MHWLLLNSVFLWTESYNVLEISVKASKCIVAAFVSTFENGFVGVSKNITRFSYLEMVYVSDKRHIGSPSEATGQIGFVVPEHVAHRAKRTFLIIIVFYEIKHREDQSAFRILPFNVFCILIQKGADRI